MVTITLFVPCIASVLMIVKEQGARVARADRRRDRAARLRWSAAWCASRSSRSGPGR
ncbi:MAG: hypothetical protein MZW92_32240 [Comamonadaceae bacterium]|nr:hypothetical protein [Comamonadaceae bacterium]